MGLNGRGGGWFHFYIGAREKQNHRFSLDGCGLIKPPFEAGGSVANGRARQQVVGLQVVFGRGDRVGCPLGWFNEPKNRINRFVSLLLNVCLRNCEEWSPIFGGKSNTFQQKRLTGELKLSIGRNYLC